MAVGTLGTTSTTALSAVTFNPVQPIGQASAASTLSAADLAAIDAAIVNDNNVAAFKPLNFPGAVGVLATGSTHTNTTLDTLVSTGGGPLTSIQIGAIVLGVGIPPGTFVAAKPTATSVTLSQAATASASIRVIFAQPVPGGAFTFEGRLWIPNRGMLNVFPGDVVAVDNTGWPILISGSSIGYAGTLWNKV